MKSTYSVGFDKNGLARAKKILTTLLICTTFFAIAGIHQSVVSGDFDNLFLKPFRVVWKELNEPIIEEPAMIEPEYTEEEYYEEEYLEPTAEPVQQQPVYRAPSCIQYNIREGEFASNKCYSQGDYDDLRYYLQRYNTAVFEHDSAIASMRITCSGSEFFKQSCEDDTKRKADSEIDINNYRTTVHSIIGKGR